MKYHIIPYNTMDYMGNMDALSIKNLVYHMCKGKTSSTWIMFFASIHGFRRLRMQPDKFDGLLGSFLQQGYKTTKIRDNLSIVTGGRRLF